MSLLMGCTKLSPNTSWQLIKQVENLFKSCNHGTIDDQYKINFFLTNIHFSEPIDEEEQISKDDFLQDWTIVKENALIRAKIAEKAEEDPSSLLDLVFANPDQLNFTEKGERLEFLEDLLDRYCSCQIFDPDSPVEESKLCEEDGDLSKLDDVVEFINELGSDEENNFESKEKEAKLKKELKSVKIGIKEESFDQKLASATLKKEIKMPKPSEQSFKSEYDTSLKEEFSLLQEENVSNEEELSDEEYYPTKAKAQLESKLRKTPKNSKNKNVSKTKRS